MDSPQQGELPHFFLLLSPLWQEDLDCQEKGKTSANDFRFGSSHLSFRKEVQNGKQCNVYSAMDQNHQCGFLSRRDSSGCGVVVCLGLDSGA